MSDYQQDNQDEDNNDQYVTEPKEQNNRPYDQNQDINDEDWDQMMQQLKKNFNEINYHRQNNDKHRNQMKEIGGKIEDTIDKHVQKKNVQAPMPSIYDLTTPSIKPIRNKLTNAQKELKGVKDQIKSMKQKHNFLDIKLKIQNQKNLQTQQQKKESVIDKKYDELQKQERIISRAFDELQGNREYRVHIEEIKENINIQKGINRTFYEEAKQDNPEEMALNSELIYYEQKYREESVKRNIIPHLFKSGREKQEYLEAKRREKDTDINVPSEGFERVQLNVQERFNNQNDADDKINVGKQKKNKVSAKIQELMRDPHGNYDRLIKELDELKIKKKQAELEYKTSVSEYYQMIEQNKIDKKLWINSFKEIEVEANTFIAKQNELCRLCSHKSTPIMLQIMRELHHLYAKDIIVIPQQQLDILYNKDIQVHNLYDQKGNYQNKIMLFHPLKDTLTRKPTHSLDRDNFGFFSNNQYTIAFDDSLFFGDYIAEKGLGKLIFFLYQDLIVGVQAIYGYSEEEIQYRGCAHIQYELQDKKDLRTEEFEIEKGDWLAEISGSITEGIDEINIKSGKGKELNLGKRAMIDEEDIEIAKIEYAKEENKGKYIHEKQKNYRLTFTENQKITAIFGAFDYRHQTLIVDEHPIDKRKRQDLMQKNLAKIEFEHKDDEEERQKAHNQIYLENQTYLKTLNEVPNEDSFLSLAHLGFEFTSTEKQDEIEEEIFEEDGITPENRLNKLMASRKIKYKLQKTDHKNATVSLPQLKQQSKKQQILDSQVYYGKFKFPQNHNDSHQQQYLDKIKDQHNNQNKMTNPDLSNDFRVRKMITSKHSEKNYNGTTTQKVLNKYQENQEKNKIGYLKGSNKLFNKK